MLEIDFSGRTFYIQMFRLWEQDVVCDDYKRWHIWQQANAIIAGKHFVKCKIEKVKQKSQMLYFLSIDVLHNCVCCNLICFHFHPSDPILEQNIGFVQMWLLSIKISMNFVLNFVNFTQLFFSCHPLQICNEQHVTCETLSFLPSDDWSAISPM